MTRLTIFDGPDPGELRPGGHRAWWRVNGHKLCVHIWTADEWSRLVEQPTDAQYYPCGVWCAMRPEE